jgi:hypothetical protein
MDIEVAATIFGYRVDELSELRGTDLRTRWKNLARNYHPDKTAPVPEERERAHQNWLRFMEAYELLKRCIGGDESHPDDSPSGDNYSGGLGADWDLFKEILGIMMDKIRNTMSAGGAHTTEPASANRREYAIVDLSGKIDPNTPNPVYQFTLPVKRIFKDLSSGEEELIECHATYVIPIKKNAT